MAGANDFVTAICTATGDGEGSGVSDVYQVGHEIGLNDDQIRNYIDQFESKGWLDTQMGGYITLTQAGAAVCRANRLSNI